MSDELNRYIGFGRFDPNPQPLTDAQRRIVDAIPLTERATVNELRTQLAAMTAERDQWRCLLDNVIRMHPDDDDDGNAPGHSHSKPGIWDDDNKPAIRGAACQWCHVWNAARNALEATK